MDKNYVIVSHNHNENNAFYYKGFINGSYWFGKVTEAKRFTYEEVLKYLTLNPSFAFLGVSIVRIEDCTFDLLEQIEAKEQWQNELWQNFHSWLYVAR